MNNISPEITAIASMLSVRIDDSAEEPIKSVRHPSTGLAGRTDAKRGKMTREKHENCLQSFVFFNFLFISDFFFRPLLLLPPIAIGLTQPLLDISRILIGPVCVLFFISFHFIPLCFALFDVPFWFAILGIHSKS